MKRAAITALTAWQNFTAGSKQSGETRKCLAQRQALLKKEAALKLQYHNCKAAYEDSKAAKAAAEAQTPDTPRKKAGRTRWHPLLPPRATLSHLHASLSPASTYHPLLPPRANLSRLHASLSPASTCHHLVLPRVTFSRLHASLSPASTCHPLLPPRVTFSRLHVSLFAPGMEHRKTTTSLKQPCP